MDEQILNMVREEGHAATVERFAEIDKLADALMDFLHGDGWTIAHTIRELARCNMTLAQAQARMEEMN